MCLDIGDKRIGIAVSDPFNSYALPVETYHRKNLKTDLSKIVGYVKDKCATALVCGLPVNFDGTPSIQTEKTLAFVEELKKRTKLPIEFHDERFSTMEAHRVLISEDMSRQKRKKFVDAIAATFILEDYMKKIELENK